MNDEERAAATLKNLKRQRTTLKTAATNFNKKLDTWRDYADDRDVYLLEQSLASFIKKYEDFESIQTQLEDIDENEVQHREGMEDAYDAAVARAKKYLRENSIESDARSVQSNESSNLVSGGSFSGTEPKISIKLPSIPLPKFDGSIENWASFYDIFTSVIEAAKLSDAGKLTYLKQSVTGKAFNLIDSLSSTDDNYKTALKLLKSKFDFPRRALRRHWVILREYPRLQRDTPAALGGLVDIFHKHLKALENLGAPVAHWDVPIIDLILTKIGNTTTWYWELTLQDNLVPSYHHLLNFLEKRANSSEFTSHAAGESSTNQNQKPYPPKRVLVSSQENQAPKCPACKNDRNHPLVKCPAYLKLDIFGRLELVSKNRLCRICLKHRYKKDQPCQSASRCPHCSFFHHETLHQFNENSPSNAAHTANSASTQNNASGAPLLPSLASCSGPNSSSVLLGSAVFQIQGPNGQFHPIRGVIDSAATSSFLRRDVAKRLGIKYNYANPAIEGIGAQAANIVKGSTYCYIKPIKTSTPVLRTETSIVDEITSNLPYARLPSNIKNHYHDLPLADPNFDVSQQVQFLIGADAFPFIYTGEKRFNDDNLPPALNSIFGWVVTGRVGNLEQPTATHTTLLTMPSIEPIVRKFWEIEEIPFPIPPHPDDVIAENMYNGLHYREPDGRYVSPLLLRADAPPLGETKHIALSRLNSVERKLAKDKKLETMYNDFLSEYERLGHMTEVSPQNANKAKCYIPHHYVTKGEGANLKIRVVFDGSVKTSTSYSLNDLLYSGPKLQRDVFDIMLCFRVHQYVFTCDISKMYRQIKIRPEDRKYQHIFWRKNGILKEFELDTASYGVTSSSFVAIRTTAVQLKKDEGHRFPMAAKVIDKDMFVDDLATGEDTKPRLMELARQVVDMLKTAKCDVSKWGSNCKELLATIPPEHRVSSLYISDQDQTTKILGIRWDAKSDSFFYAVKIERHKISKRNILSHLSRLFDPLGLICPIILSAKIIMQRLWIKGISNWDEPVNNEIATTWSAFYEKLPLISSLRIDRCVTLKDAKAHTLAGFCDASQVGYCATVYLCSRNEHDIKVSLLAAKSKVAPTKTVSIPRLELCAAKLLATLMTHVKTQLPEKITIDDVAAFTDSQVVLAWVRTLPCQLKSFEANRVTYILERTEPSCWRFVSGTENPADLGSRGCQPDELMDHPLWFKGPPWLSQPIESWPSFAIPENPPQRGLAAICLLVNTDDSFWETLIAKHSKLYKLQRTTAWLLRFFSNLQKDPVDRIKTRNLSVSELNKSIEFLIKIVQRKHFLAELHTLQITGEAPRNLLPLTPFIDQNGLIRVGGRLSKSNLPYDSKHPILLPKFDPLVNLIIDSHHERYLHAGPRLLQSLLARQFWIISARSIIRSRLTKCLPCFKANPRNTAPLMGDLPASRINISKAFLHVQIDFGGPFRIREHKRRNPKIVKAYLSLFICQSTRAIHLECVSELTTEALLAAIDRFVSRRGLCKTVLTDNATNFTGAIRHFKEIYDHLAANKETIEKRLVDRNIEWKTIPANGPHWGGLHEAGIKSVKYHLKRIIGEQTLTFEELSTIFAKCEAILNSRPIYQLSTDVEENDVLTPGHFLVNGPIVAVPQYSFLDVQTNRLSRWELLQKLTQSFWKVWSRDYVHTLIKRSKWQRRSENLQVGQLVLIADDDTPPTLWKKGIIETVHPGKDNVVRMVSVRTASSTIKRPVVKIYPLPKQ